MLNYIKAELYRNFNRAYYWGYVGALSILGLLFNFLSTNHNAGINLAEMFEFFTYMLSAGIFFVLPILDMTTAEEQKSQTLKNIVSFGVSRNKLILSKIITSVILSFIALFIILIVFLGSGIIIFGIGQGFSSSILNSFMIKLLVSIILWVASISIGILIAFFFKSNTTFTFVYMGLFAMTGKIVKGLALLVSDKFKYVGNILITTQFKNLSEQPVTNNTLIFASVVGIVYIIVFAVLTMVYVKNMEVK